MPRYTYTVYYTEIDKGVIDALNEEDAEFQLEQDYDGLLDVGIEVNEMID